MVEWCEAQGWVKGTDFEISFRKKGSTVILVGIVDHEHAALFKLFWDDGTREFRATGLTIRQLRNRNWSGLIR